MPFTFLRVVGDYYERSLEWRRRCLAAPGPFRESPAALFAPSSMHTCGLCTCRTAP